MRLDQVGFGQTTGENQTNLISVSTSQAVILSCQPKARIDNQNTKKRVLQENLALLKLLFVFIYLWYMIDSFFFKTILRILDKLQFCLLQLECCSQCKQLTNDVNNFVRLQMFIRGNTRRNWLLFCFFCLPPTLFLYCGISYANDGANSCIVVECFERE